MVSGPIASAAVPQSVLTVAVAAAGSSGSQIVKAFSWISSISDSAIARTCLRTCGSALAAVMVLNAANTAAIAIPTMTMKTTSSTSVTPRDLVDIAGLGLDQDVAGFGTAR